MVQNLGTEVTEYVWDTTALDAGEYHLRLVLNDTAGTWIVDALTKNLVSDPVASNTPPTVSLVSPNGGDLVLRGQDLTITWSTTDPDEGDLASMSYTVDTRTDGASTWTTLSSHVG